MTLSSRSRMSVLIALIAFATIIAGVLASLELRGAIPHAHAKAVDSTPMHIDCTRTKLCVDVQDSDEVFGKYVGHDEPANLFYSNIPGSGNNMRYQLKLPSDPTPGAGGVPNPGQSFNFQLHPAFWFGMAMCDTQSYPNTVSTCTPDSDSNIFNNPNPSAPDFIGKHPGTAFMEMQFYPPGWVIPPFAIGTSCDPTRWCAALTIDSLSENPITGQLNNAVCLAEAGEEYVNFAFITKSGVSQAPASPLLQTLATFTPTAQDLFMNSGDVIQVTLHDTPSGLNIVLNDQTTGQSGSMTASAANGFGQVLFAPNATTCTNIPADFHPMYSTSSPATRVIWAAHSFNVAFSDEIGHFDYCNGPNPISSLGSCPAGNVEGIPGDQEPTDADDNFCFPASASSFIQVSGCTDANFGFDGVPYQRLWPDGNPDHPTPIQFSSPLTAGKAGYTINYNRTAFETDLPDLESVVGTCNVSTGAGCTLLPVTDDGQTANFYPYFSITLQNAKGIPACRWQLGDHIPGSLTDFGKNFQYGHLLQLTFLRRGGGGATEQVFPDFQGPLPVNPCPAFNFPSI
jgi:hypothetical protein